MGIKSKKNRNHPFEQQLDELCAQGNRNAGRKLVVNFLFCGPLIFVVGNGSFFLLAWLIGFIQIWTSSEGSLATIRTFLFIIMYCAYLFGFAFVCVKAKAKLKKSWGITDD